jgi:hypothetical protein
LLLQGTTLYYRCPEEAISPKSDVYALGITACCMALEYLEVPGRAPQPIDHFSLVNRAALVEAAVARVADHHPSLARMLVACTAARPEVRCTTLQALALLAMSPLRTAWMACVVRGGVARAAAVA